MKIKQLLLLLILVTAIPFSSFKNIDARKGDKGVYGYVFLRGVWTDSKHALISKIIYQPPYPECKEGNNFWGNAQAGFRKYLDAYYDQEKNTQGNIESKHGSYSSSFTTQRAAQDAMDELIASEKNDGHEVVNTSYNYTCKQ